MNRFLTALLLSLLVLGPARAQSGDEPIVATDLFQLKQLGDVTVSPDGRSVVYAVREIVEEDDGTHAYRDHLWMASAAGRTAPHPLTRGDQGASQPAWHPDGDRLAFVRSVDGTPQVFVLPLLGGEAYAVTDLPHGAYAPAWSPEGDRLLVASTLPDSALAADDDARGWTDERPGRRPGDARGADADPDGSLREIRAWLQANQADDQPRVFTRLDLQGELDLAPQLSYRHLFVVDVETGRAQDVTPGFVSVGDGAWLPGGTGGTTQVVYSRPPRGERRHPDRVRERELWVAQADGSGQAPFLAMDGYRLTNPTPAPTGTSVAFLATPLADAGYAQPEVGVYDLDGRSDARLLTTDFDRVPGQLAWSSDGWHLFFVAPSEGGFPLFRIAPFAQDRPFAVVTDPILADSVLADSLRPDSLGAEPLFGPSREELLAQEAVPVDTLEVDSLAVDAAAEDAGPPVVRLSPTDVGVRSYAVGRGALFYVLTEPTNPYELYVNTLEFDRPQRLTDHNASWLAGKRISTPTPYLLQRDSLSIPYWVIEPTFREEGTDYPLLVQIHGGPMAMWGPGEATMWLEFQFFAARGYGVVFGNQRGSGGYGYDFRRANYQDWGPGPAADVLAITRAAESLPWVDLSRLAVTGGSYAGYLTAYLLTLDHPYKAAVAQRGVYDLTTFLGEGNAWRLVPYHFGGYPWDNEPLPPPTDAAAPLPEADQAPVAADEALAAALREGVREGFEADTADAAAPAPRSVRDVLADNSPLTFVERIETPLLIMHGDLDLRTGVIQSEMLYKSLKILDRPVEYVRYPDAGHDLSRSGAPDLRLDRLLRIYEFVARYVE